MEELFGRGSRRSSGGVDEREGKGVVKGVGQKKVAEAEIEKRKIQGKGGGGRDREGKIREKGGRDSREGGVFLRVLEVTA